MKPQHYLLITIVILFFSYVLRIHNLDQDDFWIDEQYTWQTMYTTEVYDDFMLGMEKQLIHMPTYFALMLTYPGDHGLFSLRFPSVLFGLLSIAMTMRIMTHVYRAPRWALLVGFMLAIHAMFVMHSRTARMYPMLNFLIATISYLFLCYSPYQNKIGKYIFTLGLTAIAFFTHLATLMLIPAQGLIKLSQFIRREITIQNLILWLILHMLLTIPVVLWVALMFSRTFDGLGWVDPLTTDRILYGIQTLFLGSFNTVSLPYWKLGIPIFVFAVFIFVIFSRRIPYALYWLGLTLLPMTGLIMITPIKLMFHQRYLSSAIFAYVLLVVLGYKALYEKLAESYPKAAQLVVGILIVVYILLMAFFTISRMPDGIFIRAT